jgi:hypothetical protein
VSLVIRTIAATIAVASFLCLTTSTVAQQHLNLYGSVGAALNTPFGSMQSINGIPSPGPLQFSSESGGIGPWTHAGLDWEIASWLRIGARAGLSWYDLKYAALETVPIATPDGGTRPATIRHSLATSFTVASLAPVMRFCLHDLFSVDVGLPFGLPVSNGYIQKQRFIDPPDLPFVDGSIEPVTGQGAIPDFASFVPGISVGAEATLPLIHNKGLLLVPRLSAFVPFTSWHDTENLRTWSVAAGIGLRYDFFAAGGGAFRDTTYFRDTLKVLSTQVASRTTELLRSTSDEIVDGDTIRIIVRQSYRTLIPKPPSVLEASLELAFASRNGEAVQEAQIQLKNVERIRTVPLIPVVAFDDGSDRLPERYVRLSRDAARTWTEASGIVNRPPHWQYHVLNVIGSRLKKNGLDGTKLVVFTNGSTESTSRANTRARDVNSYLRTTFGIDDVPVEVRADSVPPGGLRWLVVESTNSAIMQPLTQTDTVIETRLPSILIIPDVISEVGIATWKIQMVHMGRVVDSIVGTTTVPDTIPWDPNGRIDPDVVLGSPIRITLDVTDGEGAVVYGKPSNVTVKGPEALQAPGIDERRYVALKIRVPGVQITPDIDVFGRSRPFTMIDPTQDPGSSWYRSGLSSAEQPLYRDVVRYVKEERHRP